MTWLRPAWGWKAIAPPRTDPRRYQLSVLAAALGGGMSSRLFRSIREERGLAYSCYAATSAYADVGSFSVYAGCQPENLGVVARLIGEELAAVATGGLTDAELARVKGQLTGGLILGLEDTESRMSRIGKNLLVRNTYRSVAEELAAIAAVRKAEVGALAGHLLTQPLTAAIVGPYARPAQLPAELRELVGGPSGPARVARAARAPEAAPRGRQRRSVG